MQFLVHEEAMKQATDSDYWRAVFADGFKETKTGVLELPEEDVEAFEWFVKWVYGVASGFDSDNKEFFIDVSAEDLIKLYALAEYFMAKKLAYEVIEDLWEYAQCGSWFTEKVPAEAIEYFTSRTKRGCGMDKLLADWVGCCKATFDVRSLVS